MSLAVLAASLGSIGALLASNFRAVGAVEQHLGLVETTRAVETALPNPAELRVGDQSGAQAGYHWSTQTRAFSGNAIDPASPWIPLSVLIRVASPSGGTLQLETIRLGRRPGR